MPEALNNPMSVPSLSPPPSYSAYLLDSGVVCFLAAATFVVDFLDNFTKVSFRAPFVVGAIACVVLRLGCDLISWNEGSIHAKKERFSGTLVFGAALLSLISPFFWYDFRTSNYYLGLIVAYIIYRRNYPLLLKILVSLLALNTVLQAYEFVKGHYIYVATFQDVELSEVLFSGELSVFRAKGLFQGPLTAVCFAVGVAFLHRGRAAILGLAAASAILANGRLGISVIAGLALLLVLNRRRGGQSGATAAGRRGRCAITVPIIAGILAFVAGAYWLFSRNPQALVRFLDTPNIANAQNLSRVSYWLSAIQAYSEYDLAHSLFGNLGFFRHFYGNSAESDWLMLLLDTGLFGFLLYVLPFLYLVYLGARYRRRELAYLMLLLITISLYTHTATPTGNVVYWLWIMQTYRQLKLLQLRADPALARGRPVLQRISYLTDACHEIT